MFSLGLQVYKQYLLWGLKSIYSTYFGLFGALGFCYSDRGIGATLCVAGRGEGRSLEKP